MFTAALAVHAAANIDTLVFDETGVTGNVFIATMPSTPDLAVMIHPVGGLTQPDLTPERIPTPQLLIRSIPHDPRPGLMLAEQLLDVFDGLGYTVLDPSGAHETILIGCTAMQSAPVSLGADDNDRAEWSVNLTCPIWQPSPLRPG